MSAHVQGRLDRPVTERMHQNFTRLPGGQTVGQALAWLREHPPEARVIYFYVVDEQGRLEGVVPTRRLLLSPPEAPLADVMVRKLVTLPADATVLEACELFIQYRLLAFPVVDEERRVLGVVDVDLYTDEIHHLREDRPVGRWLRPVVRFLHVESASGVVLLACAVAALVWANSPWSASYEALWHTPVNLVVGGFSLFKPKHDHLLHVINDGLMTLFFFVVGLEIKRQVVAGELADPRKALLPVMAALGGMVAPAAAYLLVERGTPDAKGWGIPMATDIAFVVGFLALLGPRVPNGLKIFLLALAIADDIGATLVIALAYTADLSLPALAVGAAGLGLVVFFQRVGARHSLLYVALGAVVWLAFLESGVHPTVAGVALGLLTPARPWLGERVPLDLVTDLLKTLGGHRGEEEAHQRAEVVSVLERLEHALHPWVAFLIMPVFALANAGVRVGTGALGSPVALGVALGLVVGKPVGIVLFSWVSVRLGWARLPAGVNWKALVGAGCLGGIGFTMSLFIAGLALDGPARDAAKLGTLAGSSLSAALGSLLLLLFLPRRSADEAE